MPTPPPPLDEVTITRLAQLGEAYRARRKALGVSVVAAAQAAGVSRVTWYRMEKGEPSVTLGVWANAAHVLGLDWPGLPLDRDRARFPAPGRWLPLDITLEDFPELRRLAWSVTGRATVSPREAWATYQRHAPDIASIRLIPREQALFDALAEVYGGPGV